MHVYDRTTDQVGPLVPSSVAVRMGKSHREITNRLLGISDAKYSYDYRYIAYIADDILFLDDNFLLQCQDPFLLQHSNPSSIMARKCSSQMIIDTNWQQTQLHQSAQHQTSKTKKENSLSLLINACASSIFVNKSASPMTRAASRTSRQVSSNRVMTLTMVPSGISVNWIISANGYSSDDTSRH